MKRRLLGWSGLQVSPIGLGCSELGRPLVYASEGEWIRLLHWAFDLGINLFDTADVYRYGRSEALLGRAFCDRRSSVVFTSKVGQKLALTGRVLERFPPFVQRLRRRVNALRRTRTRTGSSDHHRMDCSSSRIIHAVESSLGRLKTDYLDLLQLHNPSVQVIESGETCAVLQKLRSEGKIRYFGVSVASLDEARAALGIPGLAAIQMEYNLFSQQAAIDFLPEAAQNGVGIIARQVLARGLLTPKREMSTGPHTLQGLDTAVLSERVEQLSFLEVSRHRSLSQSAIQFVLLRPEVSCALIGTTNMRHLEEAARAFASPWLSERELRHIEELRRSWSLSS